MMTVTAATSPDTMLGTLMKRGRQELNSLDKSQADEDEAGSDCFWRALRTTDHITAANKSVHLRGPTPRSVTERTVALHLFQARMHRCRFGEMP